MKLDIDKQFKLNLLSCIIITVSLIVGFRFLTKSVEYLSKIEVEDRKLKQQQEVYNQER